ncbi:MAG: hypothetical protein HOV80_29355, partial [Polyangiaceae bacterium]|nr:hypothetical protein [Polyangiaceae bacterium]
AGSGFVLSGVSFGAREAFAGDPPGEIKADLLILHATNEGKGIDKDIGDIPELKKPPFSSYDTYKLIEKANVKLPKGKEQEKKLPNDDKLMLTYKDYKEAKKDQPEKFVIPARVLKKDEEVVSATYTAPRGQYFFVAGPKYTKGKSKGILVIGVKIA